MTEDILFNKLPGKGGDIGEIILNRPKALNALTHQMCVALKLKLLEWQEDDSIKAVVMRGEGQRAFCAGGDVKSIYENRDDFDGMLEFFNDEYQMNKVVYHFSKPYISILDGITMGGGAGVSMHGSHRVATERFSFAMPETLIGFYPDIGAAHFLNRCPLKFGMYLGLTGYTIKTSDAYACNLVNHVVSHNKLSVLLHTLCESQFASEEFDVVTQLIDRFKFNITAPEILAKETTITHCFGGTSVESILDSLSEVNTDFSNHLVRDLLARSPTSLNVTFAHINQAREMEFDELMQMNFNITARFLQEGDFFEGVRAVLIDKDQKPKWQPSNVSDVKDESVAKFFIETRKLQ